MINLIKSTSMSTLLFSICIIYTLVGVAKSFKMRLWELFNFVEYYNMTFNFYIKHINNKAISLILLFIVCLLHLLAMVLLVLTLLEMFLVYIGAIV